MNASPSKVNRPFYFATLSISIIVALAAIMYLGGGWELIFMAPLGFLLLIILITFMADILKERKASWGAVLLSLFVISTTVVLTRLSIPVSTDNPEPFYTVESVSYYLFGKPPHLPNNYRATTELTLLLSVLYLFISLTLVSKCTRENGGKINATVLATIIAISLILLALVLGPIVTV